MKKSELRELIREQVRNLVSEAYLAPEVWSIHTITQAGTIPVQSFIDDNKLDAKKLLAFLVQNKDEKYNVRDLIANTGKGAVKGYRERFIKQFQESVIKETLIGPFAFTASTPNDELLAMYHGALDGFSNYKPGMRFKKAEYKLAYQTIEKILQKKGVVITEAALTENQLKASVLSVGIINMTNGKTMHGWSIFDKTMYAFLTSGGYLLLADKDSFKVGDEVELIGNDTNRRLGKSHKIVDVSETDKDILLKMLKSNGFDYYPLRAFKSRPAGNKKLQTSYSVKGIL